LDLNRREVEHEVVLLEALSEQALRRTHRRYFENPSQIVRSGSGAGATIVDEGKKGKSSG